MSRWRVWSMIYWQLFLFNGKTHLSRNQTTGKFFSGTAKWPFDLYLAKHFFFFFFFFKSKLGLRFVAEKVLLVCEVVLIKTAQTVPPCSFCHWFSIRMMEGVLLKFNQKRFTWFPAVWAAQLWCGTESGSKSLKTVCLIYILVLPLPVCVNSGKLSASSRLNFLICKVQLWTVLCCRLLVRVKYVSLCKALMC